jgi:hypothetical protein
MNVEWGARTHREWAGACAAGSVLWFFVGAAISIASGQTLAVYLVAILIPSMALFLDGVDAVFDHLHRSDSQGQVDVAADHVWRDSLATGARDVSECRKVQDRIRHLRRDGALIPDWFYRLRRSKHETDMHAAAARLVAEAQAAEGP